MRDTCIQRLCCHDRDVATMSEKLLPRERCGCGVSRKGEPNG